MNRPLAILGSTCFLIGAVGLALTYRVERPTEVSGLRNVQARWDPVLEEFTGRRHFPRPVVESSDEIVRAVARELLKERSRIPEEARDSDALAQECREEAMWHGSILLSHYDASLDRIRVAPEARDRLAVFYPDIASVATEDFLRWTILVELARSAVDDARSRLRTAEPGNFEEWVVRRAVREGLAVRLARRVAARVGAPVLEDDRARLHYSVPGVITEDRLRAIDRVRREPWRVIMEFGPRYVDAVGDVNGDRPPRRVVDLLHPGETIISTLPRDLGERLGAVLTRLGEDSPSHRPLSMFDLAIYHASSEPQALFEALAGLVGGVEAWVADGDRVRVLEFIDAEAARSFLTFQKSANVFVPVATAGEWYRTLEPRAVGGLLGVGGVRRRVPGSGSDGVFTGRYLAVVDDCRVVEVLEDRTLGAESVVVATAEDTVDARLEARLARALEILVGR